MTMSSGAYSARGSTETRRRIRLPNWSAKSWAFDAVSVDLKHMLHALDLLGLDDLAKIVLAERNAFAQHSLRVFFEIGRDRFKQTFAHPGATSTAC